MGLHKLLMCRPTYFKVAYEINPWMRITVQANNQAARQQWDNLYRTLSEKCGAKIDLVDPIDGLPDMVFTANAGLVRRRHVYLSHFKFAERQGERAHFERWFKSKGFVVHGDEESSFEGAGDALFAGNKLFAAHGFRTDARVYNEIFKKFGLTEMTVDPSDEKANSVMEGAKHKANKVGGASDIKKDDDGNVHLVMCELVDPRFYHIDTCFCPINPRLAIWHPQAFGEDSRKRMENEIELIEVPADEAARFACNSVVVGQHVVVPGGCEKTAQALEKRGYETHLVTVDEFLKAGGACKCLILNVTEGMGEGEEAA